MKRTLLVVVFLTLAAAVGGCGSQSGSQAVVKTVTVTAGAGVTAPPTTQTDAASVIPPAPDGTYTSRCDYVLGDFSSNTATGFRLIASAKVKNTGNVGTVTKVTAIFDRLGMDPLKKTKTVRVPRGASRVVNFTIPIDQNTLDLIQAANGDCRVRSSIAGTFGSVG